MEWREIKSNKIRVFQLEEEPEVIYLIKIRDNEYMVVHEDGYDLFTGNVEFNNTEEMKQKFGIDVNNYFKKTK